MLGRLDDSEALNGWKRSAPRDMDERLDRAYRSLALEVSGGIPALFTRASGFVGAVRKRSDIREFRSIVAAALRDEFRKLIRYDSGDTAAGALAESLARVHWGIASVTDVATIRGFRWGELLLEGDELTPRLVSPALGACAVGMLEGTSRQIDPETLYRRGEYDACVRQLTSSGRNQGSALFAAAQMLHEAYGAESGSRYFSDVVDWMRVDRCAEEGAKLSKNPEGVDEFSNWARVAKAMAAIARRKESDVVGECIRIGLRIVAVRSDGNAVTAGYAAIPLVEDALCTYVTHCSGSESAPSAFENFSDADIARWWTRGVFVRPTHDTRLTGASIVVLVALLSESEGKPLFESSSDMMRVVDQLDSLRNALGHRVETPNRAYSQGLADTADRIVTALATCSDVQFSMKQLERWIAAPQSVL
jgi:hypothetical protein